MHSAALVKSRFIHISDRAIILLAGFSADTLYVSGVFTATPVLVAVRRVVHTFFAESRLEHSVS